MIIMVRIAVLVKMIWLPSLCQIGAPVIADGDNFSSSYFITREHRRLAGHLVKKIESTSFMSCSHSCLSNSWCTSTNFIEFVGQGDKGTCELNKHEFAPINDDNKLIDQPGSAFTMMMKGCLMTGCLNGGSCLFDKKEETFTCSNKLPRGGECRSYRSLSEADRTRSYKGIVNKCDKPLEIAWYRFRGAAGDRMADTLVPLGHCGATAPGYLTGGHPTVAQGVVERTVCFHHSNKECYWSSTIRVRNCGAFYVYKLSEPPACHLRYCGNNVQENWKKINNNAVCFGARDDSYGAFNISQSGLIYTFKLVHLSGSVKCTFNDPASYWGCTFHSYGDEKLFTVITFPNNTVLPLAKYRERSTGCLFYSYKIDGVGVNATELVFNNLPSPMTVSIGQEFRIWYGGDLMDCTENNNSGETCADVYAWYD